MTEEPVTLPPAPVPAKKKRGGARPNTGAMSKASIAAATAPKHVRVVGGPPGRPPGMTNKVSRDLAIAARAFTEEGLAILIRIARGKGRAGFRIAAIKEIFDRGYGKARKHIEISNTLNLGSLTDAELLLLGPIYERLAREGGMGNGASHAGGAPLTIDHGPLDQGEQVEVQEPGGVHP